VYIKRNRHMLGDVNGENDGLPFDFLGVHVCSTIVLPFREIGWGGLHPSGATQGKDQRNELPLHGVGLCWSTAQFGLSLESRTLPYIDHRYRMTSLVGQTATRIPRPTSGGRGPL